MSTTRNQKTPPDQPATYQLKIKGNLSRHWKEWFGDVRITLDQDGNTLITCRVVDQAALHGILRKVRDLGLPLLSVLQVSSGQEAAPDSHV